MEDDKRNPAPVDIWYIFHYLQGLIHPRWLLGISEPSTVAPLKGVNQASSVDSWSAVVLNWMLKRCDGPIFHKRFFDKKTCGPWWFGRL